MIYSHKNHPHPQKLISGWKLEDGKVTISGYVLDPQFMESCSIGLACKDTIEYIEVKKAIEAQNLP